jgi:hypothetical protein
MAFSAYTNEWAAQTACHHLGIKDRVSDVTTSPTTEVDIVMNDHLQAALRSVVISHDWSWLIQRAVLTEDTTADIEGWDYAYDLNSDIEKIIRIEPTDLSARNAREAYRYSYRYEYDITGDDVKLVCDIANAELVFIQKITTLNTGLGATAPFYFVKAVAAELAAMTAMPLLVDMNVAARSMALAKEMLEQGIAKDLNSRQQPDDFPEADGIVARY